MIVIVFGLPGTGKSFFSRQLSASIGAHYLSTDEVRFRTQGQGKYDPKAKQQVYDRLENLMADCVLKGEHVVVDGTFHEQRKRERFCTRAAALRQPLYFIEMTAGETTVKERVAGKRADSEADYAVYRQIQSSFEPLIKTHLKLSSDKDDVDTMIAKARRYLYG